MPVPMRIFEELSGEGDSPVTVREGREWLEEWIEEKKRLGNGYENRTEAIKMCHMPVIEKLLKISRKHKTWKLTRFRRREEKPLSSDYFLKISKGIGRPAATDRPGSAGCVVSV